MFEELKDKRILLTGATGLIGQALVRRLLGCGARILAVVRDPSKAAALSGTDGRIRVLVSDVTRLEPQKLELDYVIHAASVTSSSAFVRDPAGVSATALEGTLRTLETARKSGVRAYVFLSSMEVYGAPAGDEKISESSGSTLDPMAVRSAYPESKRMCESLCASYCAQYGVPAKAIRLAQTFGPGVRPDDGRVFAEFARCVLESRDIVLHTRGETKRSYLYTEDAADAVLTVLLKGEAGQAYNAANESTYCSIYEMARMVADECAGGRIGVRVEAAGDPSAFGYAPTLRMNLDCSKLRALGWKPETGLKEMFDRMIEDMKGNPAFRVREEP